MHWSASFHPSDLRANYRLPIEEEALIAHNANDDEDKHGGDEDGQLQWRDEFANPAPKR